MPMKLAIHEKEHHWMAQVWHKQQNILGFLPNPVKTCYALSNHESVPTKRPKQLLRRRCWRCWTLKPLWTEAARHSLSLISVLGRPVALQDRLVSAWCLAESFSESHEIASSPTAHNEPMSFLFLSASRPTPWRARAIVGDILPGPASPTDNCWWSSPGCLWLNTTISIILCKVVRAITA